MKRFLIPTGAKANILIRIVVGWVFLNEGKDKRVEQLKMFNE